MALEDRDSTGADPRPSARPCRLSHWWAEAHPASPRTLVGWAGPTIFRAFRMTGSIDLGRHVLFQFRVEASDEVFEATALNRCAQAAHQIEVVVQVVDGRQHRPEHLPALVEMAQVGA